MRAYRVSEGCEGTIEEKINLIKSYDAEDLLYVLREIEANPNKYDGIIAAGVIGRLYDMGIMCI